MPPPNLRNRPTFLLIMLLCAGVLFTAPLARAELAEDGLAQALGANAYELHSTEPTGDLRDLRPLGRMVEGAAVVGVGEATHNSREFFTMKHRMFRYLVEEKGFATFSLEANWSAGLRLDDYVLYGRGDARQIMREEFKGASDFWYTREYLDLIEWMRAHNARHPRKVRFMGNDIGYPAPRLFDEVTGYLQRRHPASLPEIEVLYQGLRPTVGVNDWMLAYPGRPLAERQELAARAERALGILRDLPPGPDPAERALTEQHARVIAQTARLYAVDFDDQDDVAQAMLHRDRAMAANTAWWHEHTGQRIVLSAHNAHIAYVSYAPDRYPKMQGAFLRDRLGTRYVNVGITFHQGSFNAQDAEDDYRMRAFTVGPAAPGGNEHTLDRVHFQDFLLDLRTAPLAARAWLGGARPTRVIGTAYPEPEYQVSLGRSHDVLIHLHRVRAASLLA
ncbi:erythromycin esterase family protein [Actinomadura craniellae]|uniref:Erythromycin esterase family protein n=1 Tax=Actinomadura craniellae TaxID=2231787 RepID=A0A365GWI8_9ACTN|nr:erythromycin esterase family protein [Actinomadura craniellae]RAY11174.1 erythromycin esterase family protein [Actinomadura craniellae]